MITEEPTNEHEILSADEQKVRDLCLKLKKTDAPTDFDFKLKARIANSKPSDFRPRFGWVYQYALPVLAMAFVVGLLIYNSGIVFSSDKSPAVAVSSSEIKKPSLPQNTAVSNFSANEDQAALPANQEVPKTLEKNRPFIAESTPQNLKKDLPENKKDFGGGSKVSAVTVDRPRQPKNSNSMVVPQNLQNNEKVNPMPVKEVLSINGINAAFENGKWTVKSVTANGIGESSGIKENDVVEAIDNQPISADTAFNKTVNGKTLTVTRNGEKLQIKLRNKQ